MRRLLLPHSTTVKFFDSKISVTTTTLIALWFIISTTYGANRNARQSGSWSTDSTWTGLGQVCLSAITGTVPASADDATICSPLIIMVSGNSTIKNLSIANGATLIVNPGATLNITGSLNNSGTLTLNGNGVLNITGNWTNNGAFNSNLSLVNFNGTTAQSISGAIPVFYNLKINNNAGVTLNTAISVLGNLNLTNGLITSTSTNIIQLQDNSTTTGGSSNSYVSGPIRKSGNDAFVFPVGKSGDYKPISMTAPSATTDIFTAEYFSNDPNSNYNVQSTDVGINHISRCEYWKLDRTAGSSAVTVGLGWDNNSCHVTNLNNLLIVRWDGTKWRNHGNGGTTGDTQNGSLITSAPVTSFSPFTLASADASNPLPVELLSFTAERSFENDVILHWATASEIDNEKFVIEKTRDGKTFEVVSTVKGAGNSNVIHNYSSRDQHPFDGESYYRLKQTDYNGKYTYSSLARVSSLLNANFEVFPNPVSANNSLFMKTGDITEKEILVSLSDIHGKEVFGKMFIAHVKDEAIRIMDGETCLEPGIYIVTAASDHSVYRKRLIVCR